MNHLESFIDYLKSNHHSASSRENYYYILLRAKKYFKQRGIEDDKTFTEADMQDYIHHLEKNNVSNYIYLRSFLFLKKYFEYLENEQIIFINPMANFENPKEIRNPTKIYPQEEIKEMLNKVSTNSDAGIRAKTILELLYSSALRPSETINLKLTDIDFKKQILFIYKSKFKKDRVVPVGSTALKWLKKYIKEVRSKYVTKISDGYVFIAHYVTGKKINYPGLYAILRRTFNRDNIKRFKPSSLRPSSATHLLNNGMGIMYIKELLGHNEITTTKTYLRVNEKELRNELTKKHPRFKNNKGDNK